MSSKNRAQSGRPFSTDVINSSFSRSSSLSNFSLSGTTGRMFVVRRQVYFKSFGRSGVQPLGVTSHVHHPCHQLDAVPETGEREFDAGSLGGVFESIAIHEEGADR